MNVFLLPGELQGESWWRKEASTAAFDWTIDQLRSTDGEHADQKTGTECRP